MYVHTNTTPPPTTTNTKLAAKQEHKRAPSIINHNAMQSGRLLHICTPSVIDVSPAIGGVQQSHVYYMNVCIYVHECIRSVHAQGANTMRTRACSLWMQWSRPARSDAPVRVHVLFTRKSAVHSSSVLIDFEKLLIMIQVRSRVRALLRD